MENLKPDEPLENEVEVEQVEQVAPKTVRDELPEFGITANRVRSVDYAKKDRKLRKPRSPKVLREYINGFPDEK